MIVLSVAYPFAPVGPAETGGAERILAMLDRGLVENGHRSLVIARGGSEVAGELIGVPLSSGVIDSSLREVAHGLWRETIRRTIRDRHIDLVHFHGVDFHEYAHQDSPPSVVTLHLPPGFYPAEALRIRPDRHLVCVSQTQREACPMGVQVREVIENGVESTEGNQSKGRQVYAACLGRICPEKGFHLAVEAASLAGVPLRLAGKVFPFAEHLEYFEREVNPRLQEPNRFLGSLGPQEKMALLREARCVLVPSLVAETSSLVAMEAMSVGTPVIAFPSGALAELVEPGRTGFLVRNVEEMANAIRRAGEIDPEECRRTASARFSGDRMVAQYLNLYDRLCGSQTCDLPRRDAGEIDRVSLA